MSYSPQTKRSRLAVWAFALSCLSVPLQSGTNDLSEPTQTHFELLPAERLGIDFTADWRPRNQSELLLLKTGFTGGGVCLGDYDGDGLADLYLTRPHGGGKLYRNLGEFKFEDVTRTSGVECPTDWQTGATFCDLDNDRDLDLIVTCLNSSNRLFLNTGDGTFHDMSIKSNFDFVGASVKPLVGDYDNDGDLDVYIITNRREPKPGTKIRYVGKKGDYQVAPEHRELAMVINLPSGDQKFAKAGQVDRLYCNEFKQSGKLDFTEVTQQSGITGNFHGLDGCWWDPDGDGDSDLYITNDFTDPDQFLRNNGDGTFTDVTRESLPCTPWFAMGCDCGDFNGDGRLDLLAGDMAGTTHVRQKMAMGSMDSAAWFLDAAEPRQYMRNALYLNTGTERFVEVAQFAGLANTDWTWSVKIADLDNDGREDVFITNGFTRDYLNSDFNNKLKASLRNPTQKSLTWQDAPRLEERNLAFRNLGELRFQNVSKSWKLDQRGIAFGAATGDLDNDGDLDLVVNNFDAAPSIYRNHSTHENGPNFCKIKLVGTQSNRDGAGAHVRIQVGGKSYYRYHNLGGGFMSSDDPVMHFGLGSSQRIDKVTIHWPSGVEQTRENFVANQVLKIIEAKTTKTTITAAQQRGAKTLFSETDKRGAFRHQEKPFDDFRIQPLLPNKLSQLGPGIACADVNHDGRLDIYLGGAKDNSGQLLIQGSQGKFSQASLSVLESDRMSEDMGCVFADFDNDGDLDLYVASGGVEQRPGSPTYRDRIYFNESKGDTVAFVHRETTLPDFRDSSGPVAVSDFDRDGDPDVFVGGRVVPGAYPTFPQSRLLTNDRGEFSGFDCLALQNIGMVTSAIWSDFDNDGWLDLLITHDYGPVRVLKNHRGDLKDVSKELGVSHLLGWWNSINGCDLDNDGDTDYVVGNLGLNTKYHPSTEKPQLLFYGRFGDGKNARSNIVEAKSGAECLLPIRGRSCSSQAMPFIGDAFPTYRQFANASLGDIYGDALLQQAKRVAATHAASGVLLNNGADRFDFIALPAPAQFAPVFGIEFAFLNSDAYPDLILVQNSYTPQRETGRMNGGVGCVLLGLGNGRFEPVSPVDSGLVIPEDAKSTVLTDLDGDFQMDLIVATNDGPLRTFVGPKRQLPPLARHGKTEHYLGSGYLSGGSQFLEGAKE